MSRSALALWVAIASSSLALGQPSGTPTTPPTPAPAPAPTPTPAPDAADPSVRRDVSHYNLEKDKAKPAIQGYDPVAYFPGPTGSPGEAKKGSKDFAYTYRGVTYWFATRANLEAFKKEPAKYEPAYGGWCAYAMGATGEKVEIDPKSFKITGGRLYLFYKDFFNDTRAKWSKDEKNLNGKADANWKKTSGESAKPDAK
ncbi:MAG: hypothetical protein JNK35_13880 [Phycisphaerae bacterium]|nr:hypothetical protein [Phycisphaerae bacterium]